MVFAMLAHKVADEIPFFYSLPEVTERSHLRIWIFYARIVLVALCVIAYVVTSAVAVFRGERIELEEVRGEGHE